MRRVVTPLVVDADLLHWLRFALVVEFVEASDAEAGLEAGVWVPLIQIRLPHIHLPQRLLTHRRPNPLRLHQTPNHNNALNLVLELSCLRQILTDPTGIVLLAVGALRVFLVQRIDHLVDVADRGGHLDAVARFENVDVFVVGEARGSFVHLYVFHEILALNLFDFLLKDIVKLALKVLLDHSLLCLMLLHLVIHIVLVLLNSDALH